MYGIHLDPQTTSDYWAHYLRVMNEAKTPMSADHHAPSHGRGR
jgi:hypothetical protein